MSDPNDQTDSLREQVSKAYADRSALALSAGGSKSFYGRTVEAEPLQLANHRGILSYKASELVLTARAGTRISEIETALAEQGQQLAFEPPRHTPRATIGGAVACGLSGPGRPFFGAARDFVLGTKIINGKGEVLQFGGQVMKNVAGYDVSRLMVGAQGTLGVILEVSLKVLPEAETATTLFFETGASEGHRMLRAWLGEGHPITASCHYKGVLTIRLSSTRSSIDEARAKLGGERASDDIWQQLRDQTHTCFERAGLWRLSLPAASEIQDDHDQLIEWGGALRWITSTDDMFDAARNLGGHATRYPIGTEPKGDIFQPLPPGMLAIQQRIKQSLDPGHVLNPGRLYPAL